MSTTIGKLIYKLYLIRIEDQSPDGYGGLTPGAVATVRTFWGDVEETRSNRQQDAGQQVQSKGYTIIARYSKTQKFKAGDLIIHEGKVLTVQGAINTDGKRFIEIDAELRDETDTQTTLKTRFMTYSYTTATEGETEFTAEELIGKDVLLVFIEGDAYTVDGVSTGRLQVKFIVASGKIQFPHELEEGTKVEVLYQQ